MTASGEIDPLTFEAAGAACSFAAQVGAGGAGEGVGDPDAGTAGTGWASTGSPVPGGLASDAWHSLGGA